MDDSPEIRALVEHRRRLSAAIRELKAERIALDEEIERKRAEWKLTETERLYELGSKAIMQRDAGMDVTAIARSHGCSAVDVVQGIEIWRERQGIPTPRRAPTDGDGEAG